MKKIFFVFVFLFGASLYLSGEPWTVYLTDDGTEISEPVEFLDPLDDFFDDPTCG